MRVVAHFGAALVTKQGLDGGVNVQNPRRIQGMPHAFQQRLIHPLLGQLKLRFLFRSLCVTVFRRGRRRNVRQRATQAFVADDVVHSQNLWCNCVAAQAGNMRITPVPVKNRQQPCAQDIGTLGAFGLL